jgi:hypothetical protein
LRVGGFGRTVGGMLRVSLCAAALCAAAAIAVPGQAAAKACPSKGAVIKQQQQIVYFTKGEYRACYVKTGKVTRLVSGSEYSPEQVTGHGTHVTVVESQFSVQGFSPDKLITMWDVKKGKKFSKRTVTPDGSDVELIDSPFGDPITAIAYLVGHTRHLDALSNNGDFALSDKSVKSHSVSIDAKRVVRWTEGSKRRSKKL